MAKKIRMTIHAERPSNSGGYTLHDEISIVESANLVTVFDVASYLMAHVEGFRNIDIREVEEETEEES